MNATHISAYISKDTQGLVDAYTKKSGIKKSFLIEEALLHHLQALKEIPLDIMIPARITLSEQNMQQVIDVLTHPPEPNTALLDLMAND